MLISPSSNRSLLQAVSPTPPVETALPPDPLPGERTQPGFISRLTDALRQVSDLQVEANAQAQAVAAGNDEALYDAVIAMNKADLALQLTIQVTNRAIEAYKQVSQMQI